MAPTETNHRNPSGKTFFGQPRMLANLFSVELWERFSFYGMQVVVLLYMYFEVSEGGLGIDEGVAAGIIGAYGGSVYLSSILGAWVADRLLGSERVLFYSAVMIMFGHIALALLPGVAGLATGLILVGVGSGGLKANATALVGSLYDRDDDRRDAGFSIFYMGVNIGALFGPLLTGLTRETLGFHFAFGLAAIGMAVGLIQYGLTRKNLPEESHIVPDPLPSKKKPLIAILAVAAVVVIVVAVMSGLITPANLDTVVAGVAIAAAIMYFVVILSSRGVDHTERRRVYSFIPMFIASAAFFSLFQQQFTVVTLYADQRLDRNIFGWIMPIEWVQSFNPIFIILLAPLFAAAWTRLGHKQPVTPLKFAIGLAVMGLAILAFIPLAGGGPNSSPLLAIVGILFLFTVAELMISPVGLSLSTKLAPRIFTTQMVALNYLSVSLGTALSGVLAGFYDPTDEIPYFGTIGAVAIVMAVALFLAVKPIKSLMSGVH
ncbi:peptide MFS transporter [Crystallibacter degradans]|uniref:peptide MFS transporter n=1 Tax=Crystallibacter degradans TaxID=2726743 RepID=UPI001474F3A0|nr:oligopeptide:H+ symporter [Arthrobacter sp. SF27]NMR28770.1 MFS transporter [Arthrobacter sp. SF27]